MGKNSVIKHIAIIGNDIHAWSAAARLLVDLQDQQVDISVIAPKTESSPPSILGLDLSAHSFHRYIGLDEALLIRSVGAAYYYGTEFTTKVESAKEERWVYTPTPMGASIDRVSFYHYLARAKSLGIDIDLERYSLAIHLGRQQCFTHPQPRTATDQLDYSLNVDKARYTQYIKAAVLNSKVKHIESTIAAVNKSDQGNVTSLLLNDGQTVTVDFVIDTEGLISSGKFESWQEAFNTNRKLSWVQKNKSPTSLFRTLQRVNLSSSKSKNSDQFPIQTRQLSLPGGSFLELSFNSNDLLDTGVRNLAEQHFGPIIESLSSFTDERHGLLEHAWLNNVLNIGQHAGFAGNQLFNELFHTQNAIERWLRFYPDLDMNQTQIKQYNRETRQEYEHVKVVHLLLQGNRRNPETLAHRVNLFSETGRVAFYESDVLNSAQWVNLLLGLGVWPVRTDPLINHLSAHELNQLLNKHAEMVSLAALNLPKHDQLIQAIRQPS